MGGCGGYGGVVLKPIRKPFAMPSRMYCTSARSGWELRHVHGQAETFSRVVMLFKGSGSGEG